MDLTVAGFDWDDGNREKCTKHGVSTAEIEDMFRSAPAVAPDPVHSDGETRLIAIGGKRSIFVAFTFREKDGERFVRPISARYMHRKEIEKYEKARSKNEE